jgi:hypothetical protein
MQRDKAHGAAHVADDLGGARATGAWPRSCHACTRPATQIFKHPNLKFEMVMFLMSKFLQILQVDCLKDK